MPVKAIPEAYHTVTPYLVVEDGSRLIEFMKQAFGGKASEEFRSPDGRLMHAEVRIGDSCVMVGEPMPGHPAMPAMLYLYVKDVDATYQSAIRAGATSEMEPVNQFYGDRSGGVKDPCGNKWWLATHVEDVAPDEMKRRAEAAMKQRHGAA